MKNVLKQMALNTDLLGDDLKAAVLAGNTPPVDEIVLHLVIGATDAYAVTVGDLQATWIDKRAARMALAAVVLAAMALAGGRDS